MSVPGIVESALGEESVATTIDVGGGDEVYVTPTRTLVYRDEGLLSDESVEEYGHDADRLSVSEGRRKSKILYEYAVQDDRELALPTDRLEEVLQPVLAGLLDARGVTDEDERVTHAFRFSELTLVITSERLLKHVGSAVWDDEYESYHFGEITDVDYEEGSVATQIVFQVDERVQRIKTPNDEFPLVKRGFEDGLLSYRDVDSIEDLSTEDDEDDDDEDDVGADTVASLAEGGIDPLSTGDDPLEGDPLEDPADLGGGDAKPDEDDGSTTDDEEGESEVDGEGGSVADEEEKSEVDEDTEPDGDEESGPEVDGEGESEADEEGESEADEEEESEVDEDTEPDDDEEGESEADEGASTGSDADPPTDVEADETAIEEWETPPDESGGSFGGGFEPATGSDESALAEEVADLRAVVERQNELLARQQETIRDLVTALREREASREDID